MTEQEWLCSGDPEPMLEFLGARATARKLTLFAIACCREVFFLTKDHRVKHAALLGEYVADAQGPLEELNQLLLNLQAAGDHLGAWTVVVPMWARSRNSLLHVGLFNLASAVASHTVPEVATTEESWDMPWDPAWRGAYLREKAKQARLLREVIASPFLPMTLDTDRVTCHVQSLAEFIYHARAFDRLPILADALEDAGCDNVDILNHCRQGGEHVRGCWPVDLILGKV
jgi:hypothetical protein